MMVAADTCGCTPDDVSWLTRFRTKRSVLGALSAWLTAGEEAMDVDERGCARTYNKKFDIILKRRTLQQREVG